MDLGVSTTLSQQTQVVGKIFGKITHENLPIFESNYDIIKLYVVM
jgi:hypothetical protein